MDAMPSIMSFLDTEGRITQWPAKQAKKQAVLRYLWEKFDAGVDYTEHDVNAVISQWHTFGDYFLLRRALVEAGFLCRLRDGSRYWKNTPPEEAASKTAEAPAENP